MAAEIGERIAVVGGGAGGAAFAAMLAEPRVSPRGEGAGRRAPDDEPWGGPCRAGNRRSGGSLAAPARRGGNVRPAPRSGGRRRLPGEGSGERDASPEDGGVGAGPAPLAGQIRRPLRPDIRAGGRPRDAYRGDRGVGGPEGGGGPPGRVLRETVPRLRRHGRDRHRERRGAGKQGGDRRPGGPRGPRRGPSPG